MPVRFDTDDGIGASLCDHDEPRFDWWPCLSYAHNGTGDAYDHSSSTPHDLDDGSTDYNYYAFDSLDWCCQNCSSSDFADAVKHSPDFAAVWQPNRPFRCC